MEILSPERVEWSGLGIYSLETSKYIKFSEVLNPLSVKWSGLDVYSMETSM